jgi:glycosyltransferase involved in cell wall biosynthesis
MQSIPSRRKKIAIFYYVVVKANGIGKANWLRLEQLCEKYDFTVFSTQFENPRPDRIRWVWVPCFLKPSLLATITFRFNASIAYLWYRLTNRGRFDIVQSSDAAIGQIGIADAHFCNRRYLPLMLAETRLTRPREIAALISRFLNSAFERRIYRKAQVVIVPSAGLRRELIGAHKIDPDKISVFYPPVSTAIRQTSAEEKARVRCEMGISESEVVLLLVSLGDFQRKGLGPLIDALADPRLTCARLLIVGGTPPACYHDQARARGVGSRVEFCGKHENIQRFFSAADAFVLPSKYEVFPAVTIEAAGGALPVIATPLNGVEEYAVDGVTGFAIHDCSARAIADAVARFVSLSKPARLDMGLRAREAVQRFTLDRFIDSWDRLYSEFGAST